MRVVLQRDGTSRDLLILWSRKSLLELVRIEAYAPKIIDTHAIDVSCRAQVTFHKEEVGLQRRKSIELVAPTRTSLQESWVSLEEIINVVQKVKGNLALLEVVQKFLVGSASE